MLNYATDYTNIKNSVEQWRMLKSVCCKVDYLIALTIQLNYTHLKYNYSFFFISNNFFVWIWHSKNFTKNY